jgi:hypothetical protein
MLEKPKLFGGKCRYTDKINKKSIFWRWKGDSA